MNRADHPSSSIECLEARIAPATLTVIASGGILKIHPIDPGTPVTATLTQIDADSFTVTDGTDDPLPFDDIRGIQVNLTDGADSFTALFSGAVFRGSVAVNAGLGADVLSVGGNGAMGGKLTVNAEGPAAVVTDAGLTVRGATKILNPGGSVELRGIFQTVTVRDAATVTTAPSSIIGAAFHVVAPDSGVAVRTDGMVFGLAKITGRAGADTVILSSAMFGPIKMVLGDGANTVTGDVGFTAKQGLSISGGDDRDHVRLLLASGTDKNVSGTVRLRLGDGNNIVQFENTRIGGNVHIIAGGGDDFVHLRGSTEAFIEGSLRISAGDGDNGISGTTRVIGSFRYHGGSGDDGVSIYRVSGPVGISVRDGTNFIYVGDFGQGASITAGDGMDTVSIESARINGRLKVNLGDGENLFDYAQEFTLHGDFTYKGGKDQDTIFLAPATGDMTGTVRIHAGDGPNRLLMTMEDLALVTYKGGAGVDDVVLSAPGGRFLIANIDLGDGNDTIAVSESTFPSVRINGGAGEDTLSGAGALNAALIHRNIESVTAV